MNKENDRNESKIKDHKRDRNQLHPPFVQIGPLGKVSWLNDRLPEMLWAVLAVGNLEREDALNFLRHVASFSENKEEYWDITLTGISKLNNESQALWIQHVLSWKNAKIFLKPMLLFEELPSKKVWSQHLTEPDTHTDWTVLANGVASTLFHQSQEATDCRWVKVLAALLGGKIKFVPKQIDKNGEEIGFDKETTDEMLKDIVEYPNHGDMRAVRPKIRSMEMFSNPGVENKTEWANSFWAECFEKTSCSPSENKDLISERRKVEADDREGEKKIILQVKDIRSLLIDHAMKTTSTSTIDPKHDAVFGIALYTMAIFIELVSTNSTRMLVGRLAIRAMVEAYISLKYLLETSITESTIFADHREYGAGQAKLIYLKLEELNIFPSTIDFERIRSIANEDQWIEFTSINLGHWNESNLRAMSESVGLKSLYDKFYNYTSGYIHSNWFAVRESVYQICQNPLHRYHNIPSFDLPYLSPAIPDAIELMNNMLEVLSQAYPTFSPRFSGDRSLPQTN